MKYQSYFIIFQINFMQHKEKVNNRVVYVKSHCDIYIIKIIRA